jgi:hypothetical protein
VNAGAGVCVRPNKEMQLTRPVQVAASQLISSVLRTVPSATRGHRGSGLDGRIYSV